MHNVILTQRRSRAIAEITANAKILAEQVETSPELMSKLKSTTVKDPNVSDLYRLEAVAELLKVIVKDYGLKPTKAVDTRINEYHAPAPTREEQERQAPPSSKFEAVSFEDDGTPSGEVVDAPAPEETSEKKVPATQKTSRKTLKKEG